MAQEPIDKAAHVEGEGIGLAASDAADPVVLAFRKDIDETLLIENLRLTTAERGERFLKSMRMIYELRRAGQKFHAEPPT